MKITVRMLSLSLITCLFGLFGCETTYTEVRRSECIYCGDGASEFAAAKICVASDGITAAPFIIKDHYEVITITGVTIGDGIPKEEFVCHIVAPGWYSVVPGEVLETTELPPEADLPEVEAWTEWKVIFHYVPD